MFSRLPYVPREFMEYILLEAIHLSPKTKRFLKEEAPTVHTLADFISVPKEVYTETISSTHIRRELEIFRNRLVQWADKEIVGLCFSRTIPAPKRRLNKQQQQRYIALLLAEPFFGNKRGVRHAVRIHFPEFSPASLLTYKKRKRTAVYRLKRSLALAS